MSAARVATFATLGAVLVWAVKATVIGLAGGLDKSPAEGPLFLAGFVLFLTGVVAIGLAFGAGHALLGRVVVLSATIAVTLVVWLVVDSVIAAMAPDQDAHWVWAEVQLWIMAIAYAVGWQLWLRRGTSSRDTAAVQQ